MSMNEIRALEDQNAVGPDGDERFVSNNVQPLKRALEEPQEPAEEQDLPALESPKPTAHGCQTDEVCLPRLRGRLQGQGTPDW